MSDLREQELRRDIKMGGGEAAQYQLDLHMSRRGLGRVTFKFIANVDTENMVGQLAVYKMDAPALPWEVNHTVPEDLPLFSGEFVVGTQTETYLPVDGHYRAVWVARRVLPYDTTFGFPPGCPCGRRNTSVDLFSNFDHNYKAP